MPLAPTRFLSSPASGDGGCTIVHQRCIQQVLPLMCARRDSSAPFQLSFFSRADCWRASPTMWPAPTEPSIRSQRNAAPTSAAFCEALVSFPSFCICSCYFLISFIHFSFCRLSSFFSPLLQRGWKVLHVSIATCLQACACS